MRVLILSPHYDDAPLSLGQSLATGTLSQHRVTVGVVFGISNWTQWFHPTRRRAPLASAIRCGEELVNATRFGYRLRVAPLAESVIRTGATATETFLDPDFDAAASDYLPAVAERVSHWASRADVVLSPLGIGDHIDHQLVRTAAAELARHGASVGFYEDRPYAVGVEESALADAALGIDHRLQRRRVSGPMNATKHRRIWYPSQFDDYFTTAIADDEAAGRCEHVWVAADSPWPVPSPHARS